jgi:PPP family 3-phenylpropionic acid transporter
LFLVTSSFGFLQPFLPLYLDAAGLTRAQIGNATGLAAGLGFLLQPVLGRLSDRFDARRPFISITALLAAGAYLAFPYVGGIVAFTLLCALGANGTTYLQTAGGVLVGRLAQARQGGAAYANLRLWGSVGYIVTSLTTGLLLGQAAADREGLRPVFTYGPIIFLLIAILAWWLPDRKATEEEVPRAKEPLPTNLRRFLLANFFYCMALYGASSFLSIYMKNLGATGPWITGTFASGVVIEVLVMRWSGRFSDRFGRRPALAFSFLLLPLRMLLYAPATGPLWVFFVQTLHGINFGIVGAVSVAFANDLATNRTRGYAQSRLAASTGLALAIGPVVLGRVAEAWGLPSMFVTAAGLAAVGAAILIFGVEDSLAETDSLTARLPARLQRAAAWLDAPPRRRPPAP